MKYIACAIFVRDQQILLVERASHKAAYSNCWDLVGGHVEPNEAVDRAVIREAEEEVGLAPCRVLAAGSILEPKPELYGEVTYHVFVVRDWSGGEPVMLGNEHTEIRWFTIEEACAVEPLSLPGYRELFRAVPFVDGFGMRAKPSPPR
jgi:8-oxo-dGTP pyrophosphatase MutT (NUDIX family)